MLLDGGRPLSADVQATDYQYDFRTCYACEPSEFGTVPGAQCAALALLQSLKGDLENHQHLLEREEAEGASACHVIDGAAMASSAAYKRPSCPNPYDSPKFSCPDRMSYGRLVETLKICIISWRSMPLGLVSRFGPSCTAELAQQSERRFAR